MLTLFVLCTLLLMPGDGQAPEQTPTESAAPPPPAVAPGSLSEQAGLRFAERQWAEAADLASQAVALDPSDRYAWDVLGSSRYMLDDLEGALRAWNRLDRPHVENVEVEGVRRTRQQTVANVVGFLPNTLLTADGFRLADRRLHELPDRALSRLSFIPNDNGLANVQVAVTERWALPHGTAEWTATGLQTGIDREVRVHVPGPGGQGGLWTGSWRWWNNRPQVALSFAAPRLGARGGVWRVDTSWDSQAYSLSPTEMFTEIHTHAGLTVSNWVTPSLRYSVNGGFDRWRRSPSDLRTAFVGGSLERRWLDEHLSTSGQLSIWMPTTHDMPFSRVALRIAYNSLQASDTWTYLGDIGIEHATSDAPLGLWPAAGDGYLRAPLLRAHPLLDDGVVRLDSKSIFSPTVAYANAECQRWLVSSPFRLAAAGFADLGAANRDATIVQLDLGVGARLRIPRAVGTLRIDVAHGIPDGANALTVGWQF